MYLLTRKQDCLSATCVLLSVFQLATAGWAPPVLRRDGVMPVRRESCDSASSSVDQDKIITDACNANPQNDYWTCYNQLIVYNKESAANTCARFYGNYNSCLVLNNYTASACSESRDAYADCSNYTLQAFAYCSCWYQLPAELYDCANVILEIRPQEPISVATIPTSTILSSALLDGPILPTSASLTEVFSPPGSSYYTGLPFTVDVPDIHPANPGDVSGTLVVAAPSSSLRLIATLTAYPIPASASSFGASDSSTTQTTTTVVSTITRTLTATITSCPPAYTDCPSDYRSLSVYTSTTVHTVYGCDGGCSVANPPRKEHCELRKRIKLVRRGAM